MEHVRPVARVLFRVPPVDAAAVVAEVRARLDWLRGKHARPRALYRAWSGAQARVAPRPVLLRRPLAKRRVRVVART